MTDRNHTTGGNYAQGPEEAQRVAQAGVHDRAVADIHRAIGNMAEAEKPEWIANFLRLVAGNVEDGLNPMLDGDGQVPSNPDGSEVTQASIEAYKPPDDVTRMEAALRAIAGTSTLWPSGATSRRIALEALGVPCKACGAPVTTEHQYVEVWQCGDLDGRYHALCKPSADQYKAAAEARDA